MLYLHATLVSAVAAFFLSATAADADHCALNGFLCTSHIYDSNATLGNFEAICIYFYAKNDKGLNYIIGKSFLKLLLQSAE